MLLGIGKFPTVIFLQWFVSFTITKWLSLFSIKPFIQKSVLSIIKLVKPVFFYICSFYIGLKNCMFFSLKIRQSDYLYLSKNLFILTGQLGVLTCIMITDVFVYIFIFYAFHLSYFFLGLILLLFLPSSFFALFC